MYVCIVKVAYLSYCVQYNECNNSNDNNNNKDNHHHHHHHHQANSRKLFYTTKIDYIRCHVKS